LYAILGLLALLVHLQFAHAQDVSEFENSTEPANLENENPPTDNSIPKQKKPRAKGAANRLAEPLNPGWSPKRATKGVGYSTGFLNGSSTFIFEKFNPETSWSLFFGLAKAQNNYTDASVTSTSGTGPVTTSTTTVYGGAKQPYAISLGYAYNWHMVRNDWIMVRAGIFGGLDYFTKTEYKTGTRVESYSSAAPDTVSVTESAYGTVKGQRDPIFNLGPVLDTFVFIRWLPQLAIGLQGGIVYSTDSDSSTKTTVRTRTYQRISGVDQAPSSDTSSTTNSRSLGGPAISTFSVNGTSFSLLGSFVLRYVW